MTKPELGTKRLCVHCGAKFYDLHQTPIACPKCGTAFEPVQVSTRGRPEAARPPVRKVEPVFAETQDALEVADAVTQGKKKPGEAPEADDEAEVDDDNLDDAAFIEEKEDADVTEIIGGDIEIEKGT
jgi:uncharacterized protein (TIGR02300 family)